MFDTCVLGVDPGVARLGLAVVARSGRAPSLLWADVVTTSSETSGSERLAAIAAAVRAAIAAHAPVALALERVSFNGNQVSAMHVARATGAVMVVAAEAGVSVDEYSPTEVKLAVTGSGTAGKDQVRTALERVHGLSGVPSNADAADAVAVALTHLTSVRPRAAAGAQELARGRRRRSVAAAAGRPGARR
jgi:crossover junction endodeoxyribonuclease RuvC